jgi:para-aminobenzoate synthetase/4-amino-4-deoxychorismate lyase
MAQQGSYNACLDTGRFVIASASPELFFQTDRRRIRMRPMKGTAARAVATADATAARNLRGDPKERAENLMILDLVRNDLGRIATPGSVRVESLFQVEHYPTVHQLTSEVRAELEDGIGIVDQFRALFPCGSVTGAPKARAMEIIRDLEAGPRGLYCGAIGFVTPHQSARFSVAIRTAVFDRATAQCVYGSGGGITWGSQPGREYEELLAKARILPGGSAS